MSNCIWFSQAHMMFDKTDIDVERLISDMEAHGEHKAYEDCHECAGVFYWFLTPQNVEKLGERLSVQLGEGRSTHTWRDLRWTLKVLARYLKVEKSWGFWAEDEGYPGKFLLPVTVSPEKVSMAGSKA